MSAMKAEEVYKRHIKPLPAKERLRIVEMIGHDLAENADKTIKTKTRSIMELHGLGKEVWEGIDAQEYVNKLRSEWDPRP
ncbi:MAG: hypothetical protein NT018_00820 [Armatimonadetes bacterium]|nr:hypothetical protein [Armatimonadota bacterium]